MDDLISRRAAIKAVDDLPNCYNGYSDTYDKAYIIGVLEELPSVQPDIVRCKDCTRYEKKRGCNLAEGLNIATENGFCSYGERKRQCTI